MFVVSPVLMLVLIPFGGASKLNRCAALPNYRAYPQFKS
jgi:hypothetical protein